ncbi:hypothetical protein PPACK8108_LOCUS21322 [Phakopsora pachyrhizi]|uniref:Secreted protein n=1 Tax=Phakopsora pachyrhizi TaxID=170000 RepID=A0AAV0BH38_PHAPC|nr:hypothetical protein PPACK8108_LOCUS21322 [Phakopsora pachyrhizi]
MKVFNIEFFGLMTIILLHCAIECRANTQDDILPALYLDCKGADVTGSCSEAITKYIGETKSLKFHSKESFYEDKETTCRIRWWIEKYSIYLTSAWMSIFIREASELDPKRSNPEEFSLSDTKIIQVRKQMSEFCRESGVNTYSKLSKFKKVIDATFPANITYIGKPESNSPYLVFQMGKTEA